MFEWIRKRRARSENRALTVDEQLLAIARGRFSDASGMDVSPDSALRLTQVLACVNAIASDLAALPIKVYQRAPDGSHREAREHPLWDVLGLSPDNEGTSFGFRQAMQGHVLTRGNAYAEIGFRRDGKVGALYFLDPKTVRPDRSPQTKKLFYEVDGKSWEPNRVLHWHGFGYDGSQGYSPVSLCRQAIGVGMASETFAAAFLGNGGKPGGVVEMPGKLTEEQVKLLRESFSQNHAGPQNVGRVAILQAGQKYTPISIDPKDAQFLELRQFQVAEICRIFRVPPHKIADYSQAQLASAATEASNLDYVKMTLRCWAEAHEQSMNLRLLSPEERAAGFFAEYDFRALLRGDSKSRSEYYHAALQDGWMNRDEVRKLENLNPIGPDRGGDLYLVPLSQGVLGQSSDSNTQIILATQ